MMNKAILFASLGGALLSGCVAMDANKYYYTDVRKENGLVIILPGIEGESSANHNIRRGLSNAGCWRAMPICNWGAPIPGIGKIINQSDFVGNRLKGGKIARLIEQYQDQYPQRPVFLVGHSGGGGIAVFAAEELAEGRQVDGLILLSAQYLRGVRSQKRS